MKISLRKLIDKEVSSILNDIIDAIGTPISIHDAGGSFLIGYDTADEADRYPVELSGNVIGWVRGGKKANPVATLLSYLASKEFEKKAIARETLDRYKEINILYNISERISASLDLKEVARLVIDEASRSIEGNSASVMLLNEETGTLEIVSALSKEYDEDNTVIRYEDIARTVLRNGRAVIVNDISNDPRYAKGADNSTSLICVPLKTKDRVIGVINISSGDQTDYAAADLKLLSTLASHAASAIENAVLHEKRIKEERIKSNLERYVASQVVKAIMDAKGDISLKSEKRNIAILFSDIRNFTSTCESLAPEEIVGYLNEYFTHMVEVIFSHEGTVNKFVGDMIVALFGAPSRLADNERQAIEAAIEMQERIRSIPNTWIKNNFDTGIGINSGEVVVGNIGSPRHMDYTAIGDEVNVASRLQSIAKGGQILVSRSVYDVTYNTFRFRGFGRVKVKGKKRPVEVFEVIY